MAEKGKAGCMTSSQKVSSSFFLYFSKRFRLFSELFELFQLNYIIQKIDFTNIVNLDIDDRALFKCHFVSNRRNMLRFTVDIVGFKIMWVLVSSL